MLAGSNGAARDLPGGWSLNGSEPIWSSADVRKLLGRFRELLGSSWRAHLAVKWKVGSDSSPRLLRELFWIPWRAAHVSVRWTRTALSAGTLRAQHPIWQQCASKDTTSVTNYTSRWQCPIYITHLSEYCLTIFYLKFRKSQMSGNWINLKCVWASLWLRFHLMFYLLLKKLKN